MKVSIEGTAEELLALSDLLGYGKISCYTVRDTKDTDTPQRDVRDLQEGADVPNRDREEGVQ